MTRSKSSSLSIGSARHDKNCQTSADALATDTSNTPLNGISSISMSDFF